MQKPPPKATIASLRLELLAGTGIEITRLCGPPPIPRSYNIFLKKFIFIYTFTLPLGLATTFFYWAIPISMFVLYILASLELLAEEIENPFGEDSNDLPVDDICNTIKSNVEEILIES